MKRFKWGILGAANIAYEEVAPAIRRSNQAELLAVASRNKERAERFNPQRIYSTYNLLLEDEEIDIVYIPLPNSLHKEWAIKAMEHGKHVLLEKPAALTSTDILEMKQVMEANEVVLLEGFMYQYNSQHTYVRDLLNDGKIGRMLHAKAHLSFYLDDPNDIRLKKELGGGALWDVGSYGVHALTQIVNFKPENVQMIAKQKDEVDITSICYFTDADGRIAEVSSSFEGAFLDRYEIFGDEGAIRVEYSFRPDISENGLGHVLLIDHEGHVLESKTFKEDQYLRQIEELQTCIEKNNVPKYSIDNTLQVITSIENAYKSLEQGSINIEF